MAETVEESYETEVRRKVVRTSLRIKEIRQVQRWIARHQNMNIDRPLQNLQKSGRRRILEEIDINRILRYTTENPFCTSVGIREHLQLQCSTHTIRRLLHKNGVHCRRPAKKIELTREHATHRVNFARQNMNRDWQNVIFCDEKVFSTSDDALKVLWRKNNTRCDLQNIQTTRRSGRISCGFWGWMCAAGVGELVPINGRFTGETYRDILENIFLPSVRMFYPDGPVYLVQDNSPIHNSRTVRNWFLENPEIRLVEWPAKSPDLNVIENLWSVMVRNWHDIYINDVRTVDNLKANVLNTWERLRGGDLCQNLVNSMPERLRECINNNGYYTSY